MHAYSTVASRMPTWLEVRSRRLEVNEKGQWHRYVWKEPRVCLRAGKDILYHGDTDCEGSERRQGVLNWNNLFV